jgi:IrrE N-terminal-like domain
LNDADAARWARRFWSRTASPRSVLRSFEAAIPWTLPLAVIRIPGLSLAAADRWLAERGRPSLFAKITADLALRALLIARAGRGLVFVDANDPEDEQRFSLAHEVAHFLRDYLGPRERALDVHGEAALEVLDGDRSPSPAERLSGLLANAELGVYQHLLDRSPAGEVVGMDVRDHEDEADRIAIELLAPLPMLLARFAATGVSWSSEAARKTAQELLAGEFGLPHPVADRYSRVLVAARRADRSVREWLGVEGS